MMQDSLFLQRLRIATLENKIAYDGSPDKPGGLSI